MSVVYPNLFILLVSPPGVGKSVGIDKTRELWTRARKLKVAPDDVTKASLLDNLALAREVKVYSATEMEEYHSLQVAADEFGVLCSAHDLQFMSVMNVLYDNRSNYKESRRGREGDLNMANPQVNLLAGTQPDFLASLLPPEAWGMGFMSRIVMIYQGSMPERPALFGKKIRPNLKDLETDLKSICEMHGKMEWSEGAEEELVRWYNGGLEPVPEHTKLKHYVPRRILTILKLCMVSSAARGNSMLVEADDVIRARDWLIEAEALMPDVFKDMGGNQDGQLIQDLHYYLWQIHSKNPTGHIHLSRIASFLSARTPAYNVNNIISLCEKAKIIEKCAEGLYRPGAKNTLHVE